MICSCTLLKNNIFPALTTIIIAGHSAGGQYAQRYAMTTPLVVALSQMGISMKFYVANPSSYVYLNPYRARLNSSYTCADYCIAGDIVANGTVEWIIPVNSDCGTTYNEWKYGLQGTANQYVRQTPIPQLISQYMARYVINLGGLNDICNRLYNDGDECDCNDNSLDTRCEALIQGNCRLMRLVFYYNHVMQMSGGRTEHKFVYVPNVGHSGNGMFNAPAAQEAMFKDIRTMKVVPIVVGE